MPSRPRSDVWITSPSPNPRASLRLFCLPYAGGSASIFRAWQAALPPTIELCPVQLPGRENRFADPPFTRLEPLVQALAQAIVPYLNKPFAFFGHSMGSLVSFELTRLLRQKTGLQPVHLFVSSHRAPHLPDPHDPLHELPDAAFWEQVIKLNGTPEEVLHETELMNLLLPLLRADMAVCETYAYAPDKPLDCRISAFGGRQDKYINQEDLAAWQQQTSNTFTLRMFPGDHFFLLGGYAQILQAITTDLADYSH